MQISELTSEQCAKIFLTNPKWIVDNKPNWALDNAQEIMLKDNPEWLADNRPE
jgi:hypothetical protein